MAVAAMGSIAVVRTPDRPGIADVLDAGLAVVPPASAAAAAIVLGRGLALDGTPPPEAYRELEREGNLVTRPGAGVYVSDTAPQLSRREQHARLVGEVDALLAHASDLEVGLEELLQLVRLRWRKGFGARSGGSEG